MQEMEQQRIAREKEEKEKAEKGAKMKDAFGDPNRQWELDKAAIQNMALDDKKDKAKKPDDRVNDPKEKEREQQQHSKQSQGKTEETQAKDGRPVKKQQ